MSYYVSPSIMRRTGRLLVCAWAWLAFPALSEPLSPEVFRIGTGGSVGTYFTIGTLIADEINRQSAVTKEPAGVGSSEVIPPVVLAQRSNGSVANVADMSAGLLESALVQSDVAHRAYEGSLQISPTPNVKALRAIASLYSESIHLVAATDSDIHSIEDLRGKRVSVDETGSGTQLNVSVVFEAFGMDEADVKAVYLKPEDAMSRLREGALDAFFIVAGYPFPGISELVKEGYANVIPVTGSTVDSLIANHAFLSADVIPETAYDTSNTIATLAVSALWVVDASVDPDLVHWITEKFWSKEVQGRLKSGHPRGHDVVLARATEGLAMPLHPGAARYYLEQGVLSDSPSD